MLEFLSFVEVNVKVKLRIMNAVFSTVFTVVDVPWFVEHVAYSNA